MALCKAKIRGGASTTSDFLSLLDDPAIVTLSNKIASQGDNKIGSELIGALDDPETANHILTHDLGYGASDAKMVITKLHQLTEIANKIQTAEIPARPSGGASTPEVTN